MAYNENIADRIRELIGTNPNITEKKMFGGLAFLIRGNMAITASSHGGIMVRANPNESNNLLASSEAEVVEMRGRLMPGWLRVSEEHLQSHDQLAKWVRIGTSYAESLPAK